MLRSNIFLPRNIVLLAALAALPTGCATIVSGTSQAISIDSNVAGASVSIGGNSVGITPYSGKIKRQRKALAMVSADGYVAQTVELTTSFNPVAILSVFWDYSTTDFLTGAVWEYAPDAYYVELRKKDADEASFRRETTLLALSMTQFSDLVVEIAAGDGPISRQIHQEYMSTMDASEYAEMLSDLPTDEPVEFARALTEQYRQRTSG